MMMVVVVVVCINPHLAGVWHFILQTLQSNNNCTKI